MRAFLLRFDDVAARAAAFPQPEGLPACWDTEWGLVVPVSVILAAPELDSTDEEGRAVPGRRPAEGAWMGLATREADAPRHPAAFAELALPDAPTPWRDCVIWSAAPVAAMGDVVAIDGAFAGLNLTY
jgi:hypothetical protein